MTIFLFPAIFNLTSGPLPTEYNDCKVRANRALIGQSISIALNAGAKQS